MPNLQTQLLLPCCLDLNLQMRLLHLRLLHPRALLRPLLLHLLNLQMQLRPLRLLQRNLRMQPLQPERCLPWKIWVQDSHLLDLLLLQQMEMGMTVTPR